MPEVDVVDTTWIGAPAATVASVLAEPAHWARWWPDLELALTETRGSLGLRWAVRSGLRGRVSGSMEIYLHTEDEVHDGVLVYYFLRLDGTGRPLSRRARARLVRRYRARAKRVLWAVGDHVDPGRLARVAASSHRPMPVPGAGGQPGTAARR